MSEHVCEDNGSLILLLIYLERISVPSWDMNLDFLAQY